MYKVLVVDDEPKVRRGLTGLIPKLDGEWTVVGEAKNGFEALEAVKREMPHLVITDIRMPHMNGLDLLGHLKEYPVHVIILSGYGYFEYAQTAVKYGAFDFLLKPLKPDDIRGVLQRVKEQLRTAPAEIKTGANKLNYSKLWKDWLLGLQDETEPLKHLRSMFPSEDASLRMLAIEVDRLDELVTEDQWGDRQLVLFAVRNIVQDVMAAEPGRGAQFLFAGGAQLIFLLADANETRRLAQACIEAVRRWLRISVSVGVSDSETDWRRLPKLLEHAKIALQNNWIYGSGTISEYEDFKTEDMIGAGYPIELDEALAKAIRAGQREPAYERLDDFLETMKRGNVTFRLFRRFCLQLVSSVIRVAYEQKMYDLMLRHLNRPLDLFDKDFTLEQYRSFMDSLLEAWFVSLEWSRAQKMNKTIEKATAYIQAHFTQDLSLEDAARHVQMNPSYFSSYFKQETGNSFVEYVTQLRMEKAKALMADPALRLYEIAQMVGYQEVKYFSRLFKKRMSVTPAEYRQFFFREEESS